MEGLDVVGVVDGADEGAEDGDVEGLGVVGACDGACDGANEGAMEGLVDVGADDGARDGCAVLGARDGAPEGTRDGTVDGVFDGDTDGLDVTGARDGDVEGDLDGARDGLDVKSCPHAHNRPVPLSQPIVPPLNQLLPVADVVPTYPDDKPKKELDERQLPPLAPEVAHVLIRPGPVATPPVMDMPVQNVRRDGGGGKPGMAARSELVSPPPVSIPAYVPIGTPVGPTTGVLGAITTLGVPMARVVGMGVSSPLK